jgi:hypothetical protein
MPLVRRRRLDQGDARLEPSNGRLSGPGRAQAFSPASPAILVFWDAVKECFFSRRFVCSKGGLDHGNLTSGSFYTRKPSPLIASKNVYVIPRKAAGPGSTVAPVI